MRNLLNQTKFLLPYMGTQNEKGQGLIEYALIILLIVIGVIVVLGLLGVQIEAAYQTITGAFNVGE